MKACRTIGKVKLQVDVAPGRPGFASSSRIQNEKYPHGRVQTPEGGKRGRLVG